MPQSYEQTKRAKNAALNKIRKHNAMLRAALEAERMRENVVTPPVRARRGSGSLTRAQYREVARRKVLPHDLTCPKCLRVVVGKRRWIVVRDISGKIIATVCKSCYMLSRNRKV